MKNKNFAGRVLVLIIASMLLLSLVSCATTPETTPSDNGFGDWHGDNCLYYDACEDDYYLKFDYENDRPVFNLKLRSDYTPYDYAIITFARTENMVLESEEPIRIDYIEDIATIPIYFNVTTAPFEGLQLNRDKVKLDYAAMRITIKSYRNDKEIDTLSVQLWALAAPEGIFAAPTDDNQAYHSYIYYLHENKIITDKEYQDAAFKYRGKSVVGEFIECGKSTDELDGDVEVNLESNVDISPCGAPDQKSACIARYAG